MAKPQPTRPAVTDELARRRAAAAERQRKSRANRRAAAHVGGAPPPPPAPSPAPAPSSSSARPFALLPTKRLEDIGTSPDDPAYQRTPIAGAAGAAPPDPAAAAAAREGATKAAFLASLVVGAALRDLTERYDVAAMASGIMPGFELTTTPEKTAAMISAATQHYRAVAERVFLKYGVGLPTMPYEDEAIAGGGLALAGAYLFAAKTGRLDRRDRERAAPTRPTPATVRNAIHLADDDQDIRDANGSLKMEAA